MIGAKCLGNNKTIFSVWAPLKESMILNIIHPSDRKIEMVKEQDGYFRSEVDTPAGTRYFYRPGGDKDIPDPASQYQPEGVHGPSEVLDHSTYTWQDSSWKLPALEDLVLYELHIGTFTNEGTFESAISKLDHLVDLGVNAIEIMPVAQFPGERNWGYDGVYPFAVQNSYGGPEGLKKLVDACHQKGIAVFLDVVYNHLGPEGNYLEQFGPYFTDHYKTPWGKAVNFDGDWSDGVREYYSENPVYWFNHFHIDGLRFDAIHAIYDNGAVHFWELMHNKVRELEKSCHRAYYTIAESDLNAPRVIQPHELNGYDFTCQWLDDFHHALYTLVDKKGIDRYEDFGRTEQLAKAFTEGFVHSGEYVNFRKRRYGRSSAGFPGSKFVAFINNHDQAGNRLDGARLCALVDLDHSKIATAALFLSPYVPMLFMGEEYGEDTPFYYFISHSDKELIKAVQEGRKEEFKAFLKTDDDTFPDPQEEKIFNSSKLHWDKMNVRHHRILFDWHKELIKLRKEHPALQNFNKEGVMAEALHQDGLILHRVDESGKKELICLINFSGTELPYFLPGSNGSWHTLLHSGAQRWNEMDNLNDERETTAVPAGDQVMIPPKVVIVLGKEIE